MKATRIFVHLCIGVALFCTVYTVNSLEKKTEMSTENASTLSWHLLEHLKEHNAFTSPFSLESALGVALAGSRGATGGELARALHADIAPEVAFEYFGRHHRALLEKKEEGVDFTSANSLCAKNELASEVKTTDFAQNCVQEVNSWVEDATRGKIKQLLSEGSITRETVMILLNALHFKGKWQFPFPKDRTSDADFTAEDGTKQRVPLMTLKRRLHAYVDDGGHAAVRLPYGTGRFAMVAMLPPQGESLEGFVSSLAGDGPRGWAAVSKRVATQAEEVYVYLPRFKMDFRASLKQPLREMGVDLAFTRNADFSGISRSTPLLISDVIQRAVIEVNEEGTEAAAATAVVMNRAMAAFPAHAPPHIRFDRPFAFAIVDTQTNIALFAGKVASL